MSGSAVRVVVAIVLTALAAPPAAAARRLAETADPVARVTQLNREALAAVDKREFEKAREILKKALELCDDADLTQHPIAARTHVHMGVVILEGFKNRELGLKQFAVALSIDPEIVLTPALATPEMSEAFDEAKSRAAGIDAPAAAVAEPSPQARPARTPAAQDDARSQLVADGDADQDDQVEHRWFAGLVAGAGFGTVSGHGELNADRPVSGAISGAPLGQLSPEIGTWWTPNLVLSAQARIQIVTGGTEIDANGRVYRPASWALALFGKASWFFGDGALRPFVAGALGGGQIRHVVTFGVLKDCGPARNQTCVDTVVAGPALAQLGGGLLYRVAGDLAIVAGTNLQLAAPKFTANVDINAGVAFAF